jgi:hypothetical protein
VIYANSYNRLTRHLTGGLDVATAYQKTFFETPTLVIDLVVPRDRKARALPVDRERSSR